MNRHGKIDKPKQLNLKDPEIYELAAQLAKLHSVTLSGTVKSALREKLERDTQDTMKQKRLQQLMALSRESSARVVRTMTDEEAIGYDEFGLPT
ncbi:MAG: type II toxin-antitoxin system VapB family antitoxin [Devosia sp.]